MTEIGNHGEEKPSEETPRDKYLELRDKSWGEYDEIIRRGNTNPRQLDQYLKAILALSQFRIHNLQQQLAPNSATADRKNALEYATVLNGSYYREKLNFCIKEAEEPRGRAGDKTDQDSKELRHRAATFLRLAANCLEMPTPYPSPPEQQEKTE